MAREHGRILCSIWRDPDFQELSPEAQRLYALLLSQRELNNAGVLPMMLKRWARGCATTSVDDVERALHELARRRYVVSDDDTEEVLIRTLVRNDGVVKQFNVWKNALKVAESIESPKLRVALAAELRRMGRQDANQTARILDPNTPTEPDSNGVEMPSEQRSGPMDNPVDSQPSERRPNDVRTSSRLAAGKGKGKGSTYVGGDFRDARESDPPPPKIDPSNPRCAEHAHIGLTERGPACPACGRARQAVERRASDDVQRRAQAAAERQSAIDACPWCDIAGWLPEQTERGVVRCDHVHDPAQQLAEAVAS